MEVIFTSAVSTLPRLKPERRGILMTIMKKMLDVVLGVTTAVVMVKMLEKIKNWVLID